MKHEEPLAVIGLREWIALPDLGLAGLRAKIDTGASTSTLHASAIEPFERDGQPWVRFTAHLGSLVRSREREREAPLVSMKTIRSSTGHTETRYVIRTMLVLGERHWPVEFTLTCRKTMRYRVLLGAKALVAGRLLVNPALTYVQGKPLLPAPAIPSGA